MKTLLIKDKLIKVALFTCALISVSIVFFIIIFLVESGSPTLIQWFSHGFNSIETFQVIPYLFDSVYLAFGGTLLALVVGIPCAIYLAEFADFRIRNVIKPTLEVLNGFPSVVIGLVGFLIICNNLKDSFGVTATAGQCVLAGWIVLGIMSLPLIVSVSEDSLRAVPGDLKEASLGLGATRWQTVTRVLISGASSGIVTSIALAFASAIGETMAVIWVIGPAFPAPLSLNLFIQTNSVTAFIAEKAAGGGDSFAPGGEIYHWVFAAAVLLFIAVALTIFVIRTAIIGGNKLTSGNQGSGNL